ncbi:hypothetical protein AC578_7826 [Pseudocercospora eumusae]|uniref:Uncharacterized protein n=1 Tax=Pseudocercospora eumusae TaxID=321146 RepID=A0A139HIZ0_9PEZI|nr:hypothetical protein AC578_7826 [Pseudocercospora eumusae]
MAPAWHPDIVVGIDFGMTCTGVAYSMGPEWPEPKTIQRWPGKLGHELRNKVDTSISYDLKSDKLKNWGFLCNPDDETCEFNELFKLYLDPHYEDPTGIAPSIEQAQSWFRDYLHCLHRYINRHFNETTPRYEIKRVEYVFSIPTTWKDPSLIAAMERHIKAAGFGQKTKERASIYLTEAEAAAVYSTRKMEKDEVFLVCDAGGGTTDLNVLKVISTAQARVGLEPLSWTEGNAVGSTLIDYKARKLLLDRLRPIKDHIPGDLDTTIAKMVDDQFRTFKCSFGVEGMNIPKLFIPIPGLAPNLDFLEVGIESSKLVMTTDELRSIFDEQLEKMFGLIDQQLQIVQNSHPREYISYLVLSGGLGSSPYVQRRARARYENGREVSFRNCQSMRVLLATEPQLAVCHGLVMARTQTIMGGAEIYGKKCSPISYGILCRERYDPQKHMLDDVVGDEYEPEVKWALNQVSWIIRQGEVVDATEGIRQKYRHKLAYSRSEQPQHATILMSTLPPNQLPHSMKRGGCKSVCQIEFVVAKDHLKLKNRHWYNTKPKYYRAEYEVRALVGTGLHFQIWGKDGILSKDHEEIQVKWQPVEGTAAAMRQSRLAQARGDGIYRFQ